MTEAYKAALSDHNLKAVMGEDASAQPGHVQEFMLHETTVSWMRHRLAETVPKEAWEETTAQYAERLRFCCDAIKRDLNVEGVCREFLPRMQTLRDRQGGSLKK